MKKIVGVACVLPFLAACSSVQKIDPAKSYTGETLCIVENADVRESFLAVYSKAVEAKGLQVKVLPAGASLGSCEAVSTYTANWNWDLLMYMRYAQISIYREGSLSGQATYDAHTAVFSKFINAEEKINELVGQLLVSEAR
ncbi:Sbal_3080 family lipoprotein [Pseudomonas sp.]|uniref:Sbal_3080 family lipoprotein n=1 Tax=Pseudomonas sp. TaxID=306 RepID=UPI004054542D